MNVEKYFRRCKDEVKIREEMLSGEVPLSIRLRMNVFNYI